LQVPGKNEENPLAMGVRRLEWEHERVEKTLDFALGWVGGEAIDLPRSTIVCRAWLIEGSFS